MTFKKEEKKNEREIDDHMEEGMHKSQSRSRHFKVPTTCKLPYQTKQTNKIYTHILIHPSHYNIISTSKLCYLHDSLSYKIFEQIK